MKKHTLCKMRLAWYNVRESNEACHDTRWQNVCWQTILTDCIVIGRMPAVEEMLRISDTCTTELHNVTAVFVYLGMKHYEEKKDKRLGNSL